MLDGIVQIRRATTRSDDGPMSAAHRAELVDTTHWDKTRPRYATVYIENKCHLACDHCYESEQSHPHDARMSVAEYDKMFDELAELGVLYLTLTGGEIFLRGDLFDIVALARKKRFAVRLYTSGTLIDEARADRIAALKVSEVQVSLYSHDAQVHDSFVGQTGAHAKTVRALELLRARKVLTVAKTPAMTFNIDALDPLARLAASVGADFRVDTLVHPRTDGHPHPLRYLVPAAELKSKLLAHARHYGAFDGSRAEAMCHGEGTRASSDSLCAAARDVVSIAADGGVLPCASFPIAGGNVRERSLVEIWRRSRLLHELRSTTFGDMKSCGSCGVKQSCDPCMAYALIENGDHRQCNAASLNMATALRGLAEDQVARDARTARDRASSSQTAARALAIVGDTCAPKPDKRGCGCGG